MKKILLGFGLVSFICSPVFASNTAITIYNQNFAVIRVDVPLNLKKGVQKTSYDGATAHIETDSVVLRDPTGKNSFQILEQNYEANVMSQFLLLSLNEGKTIDFLINDSKGSRTVPGKIIRSGFSPASYGAPANEPMIEMEGKLRFGLPGTPLFPTLSGASILKPTLTWTLESPTQAKFNAELAYITSGMNWEATYNLVSPEKGNEIDLMGWVTVDNQTGQDFEDAKIKLMAGDVSKIQTRSDGMVRSKMLMMDSMEARAPVSEKSFDEYHLYTLARPTNLKDRETKQVEFVRAPKVESQQVYIYDGGAASLVQYQGWDPVSLRQDQSVGSTSQPKVWVVREFKNTKANQLGIPLPKGKLRFYRRDDDGQLEFTGENTIDHTPKDEMVSVFTGNAFDLVGSRNRTNYKIDLNAKWVDESFEITIKNRKDSDVDIRVKETLFRWVNWKITSKTHPFNKKSAQQIEFNVQVPKNSEKVVSYTVHYSW